ncbi:MAG TPA: hypothetical protein V6C50_10590, partial [Crinalium sp.]
MKLKKRYAKAVLLGLSVSSELLLLCLLKAPAQAATPTSETSPAATSQVLAEVNQTNQPTDTTIVAP